MDIMEDLKSLAIGIVGAFIVLAITKIYRAYHRKTIRDDIEFVEYEKQHLESMKKSSVEMNRSSFRAIFSLFLLVALANLIPAFFSAISSSLDEVASLFAIAIWSLIIGLCYKFQQRYDNLKNYKEASKKLETKLIKLAGFV
jgi:F0F1-type ATP synthase membrane subunit a